MGVRSLLFVPSVDEPRMEKALGMDADGVVFDLEDAVAVSQKPGARAAVKRWMGAPRRGRLYVRVNAVGTPFALRDLDTVAAHGVDGVVLPMAESGCDIAIADWALTQFERERELEVGAIEILPLVETARGLERRSEILTASERVRRAAFGAGDWCANTGMAWTAGNPGLLAARFALAVASRACDREPPIDTAFTDIRDQDAFAAEATAARDLGFQGKFCIHPAQVEHANRIFSPSPAELAKARAIWNGFLEGEAEGVAALVIDDQFVDYPVAYQARAVLERAGEVPST